ncbi:MAG: hypothetical protein IJ837_03480 [Clostridia bacterium]|nr:hypothetical protein [Clostridia bacterium]
MEEFCGFIDNMENIDGKFSYYFNSDNKRLIINRLEDDSKKTITYTFKNKKLDYLETRFSDGRNAIFFNNVVIYPSLNSLNTGIIIPSYYCVSKYYGFPIKDFYGLVFKSNFIDKLFHPTQIVQYDSLNIENCINSISRDGSKTIILKKFDEVDKSFNLKLNGENVTIMFNITSPGTIKKDDVNLGEISSNFTIKFENSQNINKIKEIYLIIKKFFQFLCNFRDISFDEIKILGQFQDDFKYQEIGRFYELLDKYDNNYNYRLMCPVSYYFNKLPKLFKTISEEKINFNYIHKNNEELYTVSPEQYIKCCGAFEYNYNNVFVKPKMGDLRKKVLKDFKEKFVDNKDVYNSKQRDFCKKAYKILKRDDASVENSYNNCINKYRGILKRYLQSLSGIYEIAKTPQKLGHQFALRRNLDAHGEMGFFSNDEICAYMVAQAIINCLILEKSGYSSEEIEIIINQKFVEIK